MEFRSHKDDIWSIAPGLRKEEQTKCDAMLSLSFILFCFLHKLKIQLQKESKIQPTRPKQRNPSGNQ